MLLGDLSHVLVGERSREQYSLTFLCVDSKPIVVHHDGSTIRYVV